MKKFIINVLLRLLAREHYSALSKESSDKLLMRLAKEEGFERLPDYLQQCADTYRNQYLYSGNEMFKGSVLAFVSLREQILTKRNQEKKLTDKNNKGKIGVSY